MIAHHDGAASLRPAVEACGEEGRTAVEYLRARKTRIGLRRVRSAVGAFWTPMGNINLNTLHYSHATPFTDLRLLTLVVHEVRHLQQGLLTALSVYGELEAWQLQFRLYYRLSGTSPHPMLAELLSLSLNWERDNLQSARHLMQGYAGKGYRVDLLPLYPLQHEIAFLLSGRHPIVV